MFEAIFHSLQWRARLLLRKLVGGLNTVPWSLLWKELRRPHRGDMAPPSISLQQQRSDGLNLVKVNEDEYYVVPTLTPELLKGVYLEIYNDKHDNHYEHGGCRIRPGDVVIDGGSCEGFFTRFALERGARVITVEPWSVMAGALELTFAEEIAEGRVVIVHALLGDASKEGWLHVNPDVPTGSSAQDKPTSGVSGEPVPVLTIDDVVKQSGFERCDFIKLDIEGSEVPAIRGASGTLRAFRPKLALCAYHKPYDYRDLVAELQNLNLGYTLQGKGITEPRETLDGIPRPIMLHAWMA
jgi:FkbM family methyltransferase